MHMPIVANPELLLIGNPRKRRRRRRKASLRIRSHRRRRKNGGKSRGIHKHWKKVGGHRRRVNRGGARKGSFGAARKAFWRKHKGKLSFKAGTRKFLAMWKRK